jgi:hypothetical protein
MGNFVKKYNFQEHVLPCNWPFITKELVQYENYINKFRNPAHIFAV